MMKFYCVTFYDEGAPENIGGAYFRRKKDAEKFKRDLLRCSREPQKCYCGLPVDYRKRCEECGFTHDGGYWCHLPPTVETIELTGTARQKCWQALIHQLVK